MLWDFKTPGPLGHATVESLSCTLVKNFNIVLSDRYSLVYCPHKGCPSTGMCWAFTIITHTGGSGVEFLVHLFRLQLIVGTCSLQEALHSDTTSTGTAAVTDNLLNVL